MPLMEKDVVLTTQEAIEYLKISRTDPFEMIRLGRIRATGDGNVWRIQQSELYRSPRVER